MTSKILLQNKQSWNRVAHHFNGVDALPHYGPFAQKEDELNLFEDVKGKKVLDIGCGSGHSLRYMSNKEAAELWGVDLSETQLDAARQTLKNMKTHLYCGAMEEDVGLPVSYFDVVYSIYAIGWTTNLSETFKLISSYLKPGGYFIFSWDHPLYVHLKSNQGQIYLEGSYQDEGSVTYQRFKGEDAPMTIPKRKLSTYINELIKAGFTIDTVVESDVPSDLESMEEEISDKYYSLYKARKFPSTMIIKAKK
ncbi:class I SAM-dependent methyltransferase [Alkalicoccobacillus porphyridii]|uniref:Class I SAM-dependent methyltransferase n=1 Tax=Alkalicoccobacillus porphyridii TaxID=2597270 RepID=A0A554A237_9BACI|nr:class I SAM-dependent methyltransferase [Alkalicoccobacillus porphyridii]TSB47761.1 class I SAM-dependent methyltransferase [Alkalicoccobacillus porphyridii]